MIRRQQNKKAKSIYEGNIKSAIIMKQYDQIIKEIKNNSIQLSAILGLSIKGNIN